MNPVNTYLTLVNEASKRFHIPKVGNSTEIVIGSATCENASGAVRIEKVFKRLIKENNRDDIFLKIRGCTGRCSLEPIVTIIKKGKLPVSYHNVTTSQCEEIFRSHVLSDAPVGSLLLNTNLNSGQELQFVFCEGGQCAKEFAHVMREQFERACNARSISSQKVGVFSANCFGLCSSVDLGRTAHILVRPSNIIYKVTSSSDLDEIIDKHIEKNQIVNRLISTEKPIDQMFFELFGDVPYFQHQSRVALRNCGVIYPESLDDFLLHKGFNALATVLQKNDPFWPIEEVTRSKLRGRGGAGYPTGLKWRAVATSQIRPRYIICNADEGDPGAFMDRDMLESDPFSIIEGMLIAAYAIGANQGFFYIRAEYPLAVKRVENALACCREHGILGQNILGSEFSCEIEIRLGAGAFVCGEETSLIASIEGKRGWPRIRPPYPSQSGLWGFPTIINNVETYANVPAVINYGAEWFSRIGSKKSGGTKVFALSGSVNNTGLVEVPMGTTLRTIVYDIGGGIPDNRKLKAVQTGGPAGGCIPADKIDTIVDYDTLMEVGSIMGSGGMIVMDDSKCMVDTAKFFMAFSQDESCGECTPCREGSKRLLEILERITTGKGVPEDIEKLERLCHLMSKASLCGLGRAASNPVLSTLRYFRHEYEMHIHERRCPTGQCHFEESEAKITAKVTE